MSALAHSADRHADFVRWMENRARYIAQSAATKDGSRAEIPPRELAPIVGNALFLTPFVLCPPP